jgi:3'-5' exoribonuclease
MKQMVDELVVNEQATTFFFVPETPIVRKSKKDKPYLCLKLQDKTGIVDGRVWDYPNGFDPLAIKKGSFIKVKASVGEWNDVMQLSIENIRLVVPADEVDFGDFFERSVRDPQDMADELVDLWSAQTGISHVYNLMMNILIKYKDKILEAPAGKTLHHAYIGGLVEHVLSMSQVAIPICEHYRVDKDLILAACFLHDIGKIQELTYPVGIGYSVEGNLLGHITLGMDMVSREIDNVEGFPHKTKVALLHLIASHHGLMEYGSPRVPLMKEAVVFHLVDALDAKTALCDRIIKKGTDDTGTTEWVKELGGPMFVLS